MQTIADVMSRDVRVIAPHDTVQRAAQLMETLNVGALPVCDGQRLVAQLLLEFVRFTGVNIQAGTGLLLRRHARRLDRRRMR